MNETKRRIKDYWNIKSSTFDNSPGHVVNSGKEKDAWKYLLENKLGNEVERVLDVGVGTGLLSLILAEMGYDVVGIDISERMLNEARRKAEEQGVKIDFRVGDAENLPFKDESFDAIVNRAVLCTLPKPEEAIREWKRVLKPDGRVCFFLHEPHGDGISYYFRRQLRNLLVLLAERRNPWNSLYDGKLGVELPFRGGVEPAAVVNLLKRVGLEKVSAEPTDELEKVRSEKMPLRYKIAHNHSQFCYTALKPKEVI